jgi:LysR family cys regulon transcriptional activator
LTEVANALLTSQSGVSKHVKDFEDELGVELFVRRGKRLLGLTDAGKEAIEIVERMLIDAQNLAEIGGRMSSADEGTLRIVTTHTQARYTLPPIIARFKQSFPNVRLSLNQASPRDIAPILLEGETDIGLATDTMENTAGLVTFPYYTWEHAIIVPAGHPLELKKSLTLDDVAEWPIITYDEGLTGRTRIDEAFSRAGVVPDIAISALDADVIKAYVELGLGVGIMAAMAFDPERDTKLRRLNGGNLFESNTSSLGVRRGRYLRGYVYRFIELCSPALKESVVRKSL